MKCLLRMSPIIHSINPYFGFDSLCSSMNACLQKITFDENLDKKCSLCFCLSTVGILQWGVNEILNWLIFKTSHPVAWHLELACVFFCATLFDCQTIVPLMVDSMICSLFHVHAQMERKENWSHFFSRILVEC